ncbi:hypothetical protein [Nocardiopsis sp. CC223A]|uniref:hypothetical protein n=1 Tax=Nocardiopsis sp. CC223A TaxID=3044051 RepID=UPI00278C5F37|nr:hypothetical protein [Nocardiopsis sp. CC223A]
MNFVRRHLPEWVALATAAAGVLLACFAGIGSLVADNLLVPVTVAEAAGGSYDLVGPAETTLRIAAPTAAERLWAFAPSLVQAVQAAVVGLLLFRVARTLRTGDPFAPVNAVRVLVCAVVVLAGGLLASALRALGHRAVVEGAAGASPGTPPLEPVVDLPVVAMVLGIGLAAAGGFLRRGAVLREDVRGLV